MASQARRISLGVVENAPIVVNLLIVVTQESCIVKRLVKSKHGKNGTCNQLKTVVYLGYEVSHKFVDAIH